jgi:hypothetical protein
LRHQRAPPLRRIGGEQRIQQILPMDPTVFGSRRRWMLGGRKDRNGWDPRRIATDTIAAAGRERIAAAFRQVDAGIVNRAEPERRRAFDQGWAVIARDGRLSERGRAAVADACGYYVQAFTNVTCKVRRADIGQIP